MTEPVRTFTVTDEDDGIRLDRWFRRNLPEASFGTVARWARTGQLRLDGKRAAPGDRVETGQTIRVPPAGEPQGPARPQKQRETLSPDEIEFVRSLVIEADPAAIVVNKPPGLATQGGTKTDRHLDRLLEGLVEPELAGAGPARDGAEARLRQVAPEPAVEADAVILLVDGEQADLVGRLHPPAPLSHRPRNSKASAPSTDVAT